MNLKRIGMGFGLIVMLLLAFAWYDGGEQPLHLISEPVALPGDLR